MTRKLRIQPNTRTSAVARLGIGVIWILAQLVLIPIILLLYIVAGTVDISYELATGNTGTAGDIGARLIVFANRVEGWNRRNLTFVFTGTKQFKYTP